jgi:hypothetical protein
MRYFICPKCGADAVHERVTNITAHCVATGVDDYGHPVYPEDHEINWDDQESEFCCVECDYHMPNNEWKSYCVDDPKAMRLLLRVRRMCRAIKDDIFDNQQFEDRNRAFDTGRESAANTIIQFIDSLRESNR